MITKNSAPTARTLGRRKIRDRKVAALSLDLVPPENQRATRALNQALLAGELHDAMMLCLKSNLLMPLAALLRSLIDTSVLGIWLLKYATDEAAKDSVAHLSTVEMVQRSFDLEDRTMFAFIFEAVNGTDHQFYSDVLHPSIHGDAIREETVKAVRFMASLLEHPDWKSTDERLSE